MFWQRRSLETCVKSVERRVVIHITNIMHHHRLLLESRVQPSIPWMDFPSHSPWRDVTALLHEGSQRKPQRVEDAKLIGRLVSGALLWGPLLWFLCMPLIRTEATHLPGHNKRDQIILKIIRDKSKSNRFKCLNISRFTF